MSGKLGNPNRGMIIACPMKWSTVRLRPDNPYRGEMAYGWQAFHAGEPKPSRSTSRGRAHAFYQGWVKAKLAKEQGKKRL